MRIRADVYDAAGNRLGRGSIKTLQSVTVRRVLDGAGSVSLSFPATDERALSLLTNERFVRVYVFQQEVERELGAFIIQKRPLRVSESGNQLSASGASQFQELARKSVLLGRKFDDQPLSSIVSSLVGLVPGWSAISDAGLPNYTARGDGVSVLKLLITLAEQNGKHVREGLTGRTLEFGAFGTSSGLRAFGGKSTVGDVTGAKLIIDSIQVETDTTDVVNWIIPLAAGEGDTALTLEKSTRTGPYPIQTLTYPDGRTGYYLADTASIAVYGQIEKIIKFSNIAPLENSDTAIVRAANALYDAAAAWLQRSAQKQESYSISCVRVTTTVRPGDKLHVNYKGMAEQASGEVVYLDIRDDFWVMEVEERIGLDGIRLNLKVNKVDRMQIGTEEEVVGALEQLEVQQTSIKNYVVTRPLIYVRQIDSTHPADVPIRLTDATLSLVRCKVWIRTRPFRATARGAEGGGDHFHRVARYAGQVGPFAGIAGQTMPGFNFRDVSGSVANTVIAVNSQNKDLYTESSSGAHTHNLTYGITDDTATPTGVKLKLNGIDITAGKGGPWFPSGGSGIFEVVLTDEIINAAGGLRQEHKLEVSCTSGQGEIEAGVESMEVVQTLAIS